MSEPTSPSWYDLLGVAPGSTLFVEGAAGAVGSTAVQLAVGLGARVIGSARAGHLDFVAGLGAEPVEAGSPLIAASAPVDRALDAAGAGTLPDLLALTGGDPDAVVTIADFGAADLGVRLTRGSLAGEPSGTHGFARAAALGPAFRPRVAGVYPLERLGDAHARLARGGVPGKLVVTLS